MQDEKQGQAGAKNTGPTAPGGLPVAGDSRTFLTHTMEGDVAQAKADPAAAAKEEAIKKPFAEYIPPPPAPPAPAKSSGSDVYREPVAGMPSLERDQPFSFPKSDSKTPEEEKQQFQIYIPTKRGAFNTTTITLLAVLLLLLAGGGLGYWWLFMKTAPPQEAAITAPEPIPQPEPTPVVVEPPASEPQPEPQPAPEPEPVPTPVTEATSTEPVVVVPPQPEPQPTPEPTPVVIEPTAPQAVLSLDQTITAEIAAMDKSALLAKLQSENKKIVAQKATLRYLVKLSTASEKKYLSLSEIGQLLGFAVPQTLAQSFSQSEFIGYKNGSAFRYGFAAAVSQKESVKTAALAWEAGALDDLAGLYIQKSYVKPTPIAFSSNTYLDFYKRYLNMPQPDISLDWALSDKYFVVATSKEMIFAILDKTGLQTTPEAK